MFVLFVLTKALIALKNFSLCCFVSKTSQLSSLLQYPDLSLQHHGERTENCERYSGEWVRHLLSAILSIFGQGTSSLKRSLLAFRVTLWVGLRRPLSFPFPVKRVNEGKTKRESQICNPYRAVPWALLDVFAGHSHAFIAYGCYDDQFVRFMRSRARVWARMRISDFRLREALLRKADKMVSHRERARSNLSARDRGMRSFSIESRV